MKYLALLGRILFSLIFILSGFKHFNHETITYAANQGVPLPFFLVPFSGVLGLIGGISILIGYQARIGAWLIILFLVPVTLMIHAFWDGQTPEAIALQEIMFLKNISILGGAFLIAYFGSGPLSLDYRSAKIYPMNRQ